MVRRQGIPMIPFRSIIAISLTRSHFSTTAMNPAIWNKAVMLFDVRNRRLCQTSTICILPKCSRHHRQMASIQHRPSTFTHRTPPIHCACQPSTIWIWSKCSRYHRRMANIQQRPWIIKRQIQRAHCAWHRSTTWIWSKCSHHHRQMKNIRHRSIIIKRHIPLMHWAWPRHQYRWTPLLRPLNIAAAFPIPWSIIVQGRWTISRHPRPIRTISHWARRTPLRKRLVEDDQRSHQWATSIWLQMQSRSRRENGVLWMKFISICKKGNWHFAQFAVGSDINDDQCLPTHKVISKNLTDE